MGSDLKALKDRVVELGDEKIAEHSQRFFKTGPGEYGEGDQFIGIRVPVLRKLAREFKTLSLDETTELLQSEIHEERLLSLFILVGLFKKADTRLQKTIYDLYFAQMDYINNWDLVDSSAHLIVGPYLEERSRKPLYRLAKSKDLWRRRISIISTYHYIKQEDFEDALQLSELLLHDKEDLMHKAVGWMLREVGNRDLKTEEDFLKPRYHDMPRTMLRYAIEKFPETKRKKYLNGKM